MTDQPPQENTTPPPVRKKRRHLRRLGWSVGILGSIAFLLNGVVARKVIHYYLNQSLEDQGMVGSLKVDGSIITGFQLSDLSYKGDSGIQSLSIAKATVDYQIMHVIDLKIDFLHASKVYATIDLAKFPAKTKTQGAMSWQDTLSDIQPLLMHPEINLDEVDFTLLNDGEKLVHWKLGSIQHASATDTINFKQLAIAHSAELTTPEQSVTLTWQDGTIVLNQLSILPELSLSGIHFDWRSKLIGSAIVNYHDATIDLKIAECADVKLQSGEIRSNDIFKTLSSFGIEPIAQDVNFVLDKLELNMPVEEFEKPLPLWEIDSSIGIKNARWKTHSIEDTNLTISQKDLVYQVTADGTSLNAPVELNISGKWLDPNSAQWWKFTTSEVSFLTTINDEVLALIPRMDEIPEEIKLNNTQIKGTISTHLKDAKLISASGNAELSAMTLKDSPLPSLALSASYLDDHLKFKLNPKNSSAILLEGGFSIINQDYTASFASNIQLSDAPWINVLAETFDSPITLGDQLVLEWKGSGNLKTKLHQGELTTTDLSLLQENQSPIKINFKGNYEWPKSLHLETLSIAHEELLAEATMLWDGKEISITKTHIKRDAELIAIINGKLPFTADINTSKKFFAQTNLWEINIETEQLRLSQLAELLPISGDLKPEGTLQTNLHITGSPHTPALNGKIDMLEINDIFALGLDKVSVHATLTTQDKLLNIKGNLLENNQPRITADLQFPFTPYEWLEDDHLIETIQKNSQLKGSAEINQLPLEKLTKFIPQLKKLEGMLDAKAEFQGTIEQPKYKVDFQAILPVINLKDSGLDDITDIQINGTLDEKMIVKSDINAKINGGKFTSTIKVNIKDPKATVFDVKLVTDHALLFRNDVLAMRANTNLMLKGTLKDATISGDIGILESLFYKDIDLIPIGVSSSAVGDIELPSLDTKASDTLPIPDAFADWKLDLTVKTLDPILIRGNVGTGEIQGSIKVRGTLAKPSPDGVLHAKNVRAKLPFSLLNVENGMILFKPNQGLIPSLDVRGKSQVGIYSVNLYVYGSANDPKIALSSYPSLPENEIMTLLATGSTNSGLTDRDVAAFKTLQFILLKLKQRNDRPDGNRLFRNVLSGIEDLDLKVGEVNELTGDKYASATIKLHNRWYLTAQIDNDQPPQTRGLIIFALRFR